MNIKSIIVLLFSICSFAQNSEYYFNRGLKEREKGNYKEAIVSFTNSYNLSISQKNKKNESLSLANRGIAKSEIEDYRGAIDDYDKFIQIDSKNPNIYFLRSLCLMEIKEYENALNSISSSLKLDDLNYDYLMVRALIKKEINDYKGAIIDCTKAINLNPKEGNFYAIIGKL